MRTKAQGVFKSGMILPPFNLDNEIRAAIRSVLLLQGTLAAMPLAMAVHDAIHVRLAETVTEPPSLGIIGTRLLVVSAEMIKANEMEEIAVRNLPVPGVTKKFTYFYGLKG